MNVLLRLGNMEDTDAIATRQEPPTTMGKCLADMAGKEETTEGLPNML